jgi:hypothetical protein
MLPVSYSSKGSNLSRDNELAISRRMKKFYKSHSLGENAKLDEDIHKIENSIISDNIDSYSKEHSFDFNEDIIDSEEYEVDKIFKRAYTSLKTSLRNIKYPFSDAVYKHYQRDIEFLDEIRFEKMSEYRNKDLVIELCMYHININSHKPFLEFMLYKSIDENVMYFPNFIYNDTSEGILEKSEEILGNIVSEDGLCEFKGRISASEIENDIDDASIDNRIILLFELKRKNSDVVHITGREHFWWTTVSEIFNYKKIMFYDISDTVTDVFMSCVDMIKIYYKKSLIETPGVFYNGNNKNMTKYNAILSLNKAPSESRYGPYYYFTDLHTSMKYACYDENGEKREHVGGAGIVRFIVFHGKMKMFMKNNRLDDSKMATYIFERYSVEKKTGQFRDNDCIWTENYNSAYNGQHNIQYYTKKNIYDSRNNKRESDDDDDEDDDDVSSNDDELGLDLRHTLESETYINTKKKRTTIILAMRICIYEYSFQTPISYHYIDIDNDNGNDSNSDNIPRVYDYNFTKYKII